MCSSLARSTATVSNFIKSRILLSGPIPVADYMRIALTAQPTTKDLINKDFDNGGYYMKKDVFGQYGDFITSPEISQLFGEMLAVWGLQTWMQIGGPKKFSIVELGPGRGTLSKDILRVFNQFKHITGNNVSLHLVEISPFLATLQCASLTASTSISKSLGSEKEKEKTEEEEKVDAMQLLDPLKENPSGDSFYHHATESETGFPIYWYRDIKDLPQDFHFYIAHEFFDALPIHKLQKVDNQWREVLVDINPEQDSAFRFVISRNETPVIKLLQQNYSSILEDSRQHIEVRLDEIEILDNLTKRLDSCGGFATIIDYGHDGTKEDTFRAFYKHKLHDPLVDVGKADLTSDVDFSFIKKLLGNRAMICGPATQRDYFSKIGIEHRLKMLVDNSKLPEEERNHLVSGYKMIMEEMGSRFHVMSLFPNVLKTHMPNYKPIGFS